MWQPDGRSFASATTRSMPMVPVSTWKSSSTSTHGALVAVADATRRGTTTPSGETLGVGQGLPHGVLHRLDLMQRQSDMPEKSYRIVVGFVQVHPAEVAVVLLRPLAQRGGLAIPRRRDEQDQRHVILDGGQGAAAAGRGAHAVYDPAEGRSSKATRQRPVATQDEAGSHRCPPGKAERMVKNGNLSCPLPGLHRSTYCDCGL